MIALIPARAGSRRIPGKNTRLLAGHPLIAYTIAVAQQSGVFVSVSCCTDDPWTMEIAWRYGCDTIQRPRASDTEPDVVWVRQALAQRQTSSFAILRPTSPFRTAETICQAFEWWQALIGYDSLRAVEPVTQHPGKMWELTDNRTLRPILDRLHRDGTPWHSSPTQTLPTYYIQNASLEMAWTRTVETYGTISGRIIAPFFTQGVEGLDLNTEADWDRAEALVAAGAAALPPVSLAPLPADPEAPPSPDPDRAVAGGSRL